MYQEQLGIAIGRLRFACDELTLSTKETDVETMLARLEYYGENYFIRTYVLRERVIAFVAELYDGKSGKKVAKELEKDKQRHTALAKIGQKIPQLVQPFDRLLKLLDHDIYMRTIHTHHRSLQVDALVDGDLLSNPWPDLMDKPEDRKAVEKFFREEAKKLARRHRRKANSIIKSTCMLLDETADYLSLPSMRRLRSALPEEFKITVIDPILAVTACRAGEGLYPHTGAEHISQYYSNQPSVEKTCNGA